MLQDASTWVMATRIVMMFAVLFYAVKALYAMKRKVAYPLLRVSLRDGDYYVVIVSNTPPSRGQLSLLRADAWRGKSSCRQPTIKEDQWLLSVNS